MSKHKTAALKPDKFLVDIARYVGKKEVGGALARRMARYCLMDSIGCVLQALTTPDCLKLMGPIVPGMMVPHGARVPGTQFVLDPVTAAFNISSLIRWHDFSDTWRTGGHPSDDIGAILAIADYISQTDIAAGRAPLPMSAVITAMIKAYEIHGLLFDCHEFNLPGTGIDSVIIGKIACTAVVTHMLGGGVDEIVNAVSNAVVDYHPLNIYRTLNNAGSRKSWAAGDAAGRGVWLALMAMKGEMGYPQAFTAPTWGFQDVIYHGDKVDVARPFGSYVMENIMFKIAYPAQRNTQSAAECAVHLHPLVKNRLSEIERIELHSHERALRANSMTGPLTNFAARDHCLQYVISAALLDGDIVNESYEDAYYAAHPQIDQLRAKIVTAEDPAYTRDYRGAKHSNTNALQVFFKDGSKTPRIKTEYPIGDPRRRRDGLPMLERKFHGNLAKRFPAKQQEQVAALMADQRALESTPVCEFMQALTI